MWDYDTGTMVRLETLPVSDALRDALRRWARSWEMLSERAQRADDTHAGMLPGAAESPSDDDWAANRREMEMLWRLLIQELGDGWEIAVAEDDCDDVRRVRWSPGAALEMANAPAGRRFWSRPGVH